eukprot:592610-Pyramimonas_sp.AAC.1
MLSIPLQRPTRPAEAEVRGGIEECLAPWCIKNALAFLFWHSPPLSVRTLRGRQLCTDCHRERAA